MLTAIFDLCILFFNFFYSISFFLFKSNVFFRFVFDNTILNIYQLEREYNSHQRKELSIKRTLI